MGVGYLWSNVPSGGRVSLVPCPLGGEVEYLYWSQVFSRSVGYTLPLQRSLRWLVRILLKCCLACHFFLSSYVNSTLVAIQPISKVVLTTQKVCVVVAKSEGTLTVSDLDIILTLLSLISCGSQ